jgi:hypothetical protein
MHQICAHTLGSVVLSIAVGVGTVAGCNYYYDLTGTKNRNDRSPVDAQISLLLGTFSTMMTLNYLVMVLNKSR